MNGAHRMQELQCFMGGATLVISVGSLNWLYQRCSDKEIQKRGKALDWWMSRGQMIQADEDRHPVTCVSALAKGGGDAIQSFRNINNRLHCAVRSSYCCLPKQFFQPATCASSDSFVTWMKFTLDLPDISSLIPIKLNMTLHQDIITKYPPKRFIVYCDDQTPVHLFSDIYYTQDCGTYIGHSDCPIRGSMSVELKDVAAQWTTGISSSSEEDHSDADIPENLNRCSHRGLLKSSQDYSHPRGSCSSVKLRKSVSFDDDVMVHLFDQERPTLELRSEPCTSLSSNYSCNLQGFPVKDNGLEWEDDFSALEKSRHLQCARPAQHRSLSLSVPHHNALQQPERCGPSQRCLFLTYVTEADLEL